MIRTVRLAALALLVAASATAQNLLVNPGFDDPAQLNGWTCTTTHGTATWSPLDHANTPGSGSMQHDVSAASDNQWVRCSQCFPVNELYAYIGSMWYFWPDDPDVSQSGSSRFTYEFYSDPGCTIVAGGGSGGVGHPITLDTWLYKETQEGTAPAGAVAATAFLFTWQNTANEPVRARIDDVDFRTTTIFRDGFESGNTGAWAL